MHRPADDDDERLRRERVLDNASTPSTASTSAPNNANASATASANPSANPNPRQFDARSPSQQSDFHHPPPPPPRGTSPPPFSPTAPRFNNPYHPPTPAPLPMPAPSHVSGPPASPRGVTASQPYASEYSSAPRDKPTSSYYDPTSDSGERRPAENASWHDAQARTPQVRT